MSSYTSDGKEVKDAFGRPEPCWGARQQVKIWSLDDYVPSQYRTEISANVT